MVSRSILRSIARGVLHSSEGPGPALTFPFDAVEADLDGVNNAVVNSGRFMVTNQANQTLRGGVTSGNNFFGDGSFASTWWRLPRGNYTITWSGYTQDDAAPRLYLLPQHRFPIQQITDDFVARNWGVDAFKKATELTQSFDVPRDVDGAACDHLRLQARNLETRLWDFGSIVIVRNS